MWRVCVGRTGGEVGGGGVMTARATVIDHWPDVRTVLGWRSDMPGSRWPPGPFFLRLYHYAIMIPSCAVIVVNLALPRQNDLPRVVGVLFDAPGV